MGPVYYAKNFRNGFCHVAIYVNKVFIIIGNTCIEINYQFWKFYVLRQHSKIITTIFESSVIISNVSKTDTALLALLMMTAESMLSKRPVSKIIVA